MSLGDADIRLWITVKPLCEAQRLNCHAGEGRHPGHSIGWTPACDGVTNRISLGSANVLLKSVDIRVSLESRPSSVMDGEMTS